MCSKTVSTSPSAIQFVPKCHKTEEICDKAVDISHFVFDFVPDQYMTQEVCNKVVSKKPFMLKCCLNRYKTPKMCDKAVDSYLLALRFVLDWFAKSKMIDKIDNVVFSNDGIVFGNIDSDIVTFFSNYVGLNSINRNNNNLDDVNFDVCDPETVNHVRLEV